MNCALCGSENTRYLFNAKNTHGKHLLDANAEYKIFRCADCQRIFIGSITANDQYYKDSYNSGYYDANKRDGFLCRLLADFFIKFSARHKEKMILNFAKTLEKKLSILDVGCGEGSFLSGLNKNIFDAYGLEINSEGTDICRKKNLNVYRQDVLNADFKGKKFNIITLWHVLEHIKKPVPIFKKLNDLLENDGILLLSTPNTDSFGFRYGKENWFHLDSPRHLILYNEKSLKKLFELSGFKTIKIKSEYFEYPLDLFWSLKKYYINILLLPIYPVIKIFKPETLTIICKKTGNRKS